MNGLSPVSQGQVVSKSFDDTATNAGMQIVPKQHPYSSITKKLTDETMSTAVDFSKPELSPVMLPMSSGLKKGGELTNKAGIRQFLNYTPSETIPEEPETTINLKSKSKSEINTSSGEKTNSLDQITQGKANGGDLED